MSLSIMGIDIGPEQSVDPLQHTLNFNMVLVKKMLRKTNFVQHMKKEKRKNATKYVIFCYYSVQIFVVRSSVWQVVYIQWL